MSIFLFRSVLLILIVTICSGISQISFAACSGNPVVTCDTSAPNPDPDGVQLNIPVDLTVNVTPGGAIDTALQAGLDLDGIQVGTGNNTITLQDAFVRGQDAGIMSGNDNPTHVTINNSTLIAVTDVAIRLGLGDNTITVDNSQIIATDNNIFQLFNNDEVIDISDSELRVLEPAGANNILSARGGDDIATLENSLLVGSSGDGSPQGLDMGENNDTVVLKTGVIMQTNTPGGITNGLIDCGEDFDRIIFQMDVPVDSVASIRAMILSKNPSGDSITINGLFYQWENCEELVSDLNGVNPTSNVPTLSEWGLIAMAGLLGIVGFIVMRRRQVII